MADLTNEQIDNMVKQGWLSPQLAEGMKASASYKKGPGEETKVETKPNVAPTIGSGNYYWSTAPYPVTPQNPNPYKSSAPLFGAAPPLDTSNLSQSTKNALAVAGSAPATSGKGLVPSIPTSSAPDIDPITGKPETGPTPQQQAIALQSANAPPAAQIPPPDTLSGVAGAGSTPGQATNPGLSIANQMAPMASMTGGGAPAGPTLGQKYLTEQERLDAEGKGVLSQAQKAVQAKADIQQAADMSAADLQQKGIEAKNNALADEAIKRQQIDDSMQKRDLAIKQQMDSIKDIDPQHWWKERGTAGSIVAALSIGLGALGSGVMQAAGKGSMPNYAMEMINKSIDNDVHAQAENLNNQWNKITKGMEINKNQFAKDQWILEQQGRGREVKYGLVKDQLGVLASSTNSQLAQQNAKLMNTDIDQMMLKIGRDAADRRYGVLSKEQAAAQAAGNKSANELKEMRKSYAELTNTMVAAGKTPPTFQEYVNGVTGGTPLQANPEYLKKEGMGKEGEKVVNIAGVNYVGNSAKQAQEAKTAIDSAREVIRINNRIKELQAKSGTIDYLNAKDRAELDTLQRNGALHYPRMQTGSTRINENELKKGEETYGKPGGIYRGDFFGGNAAKLDAITKEAQERIKDAGGGLKPLGPALGGTSTQDESAVPGAKEE